MGFMRATACLVAVILTFPFAALAFPFGGQTNQIIFCFNDAIWVNLGPPRGGQFIWTPSTVTYEFGPPSHAGQWILGLAGPPYECLVSVVPENVITGIAIMMMGSSQ